jgi:AraC-like DNA-binding protein
LLTPLTQEADKREPANVLDLGPRRGADHERPSGRYERCALDERRASYRHGNRPEGTSSRSPRSARLSAYQLRCYENLARSNSAWARPSTSPAGGCNTCTEPCETGTRPTASVPKIARQYGFRDPGRFATNYRAVYGELPSATLRRSLRGIAELSLHRPV